MTQANLLNLDVDGRFARDVDYLFVPSILWKPSKCYVKNFAWRQKPSRQFTARSDCSGIM